MSDLPRNVANAGADDLPERLLSPGEIAEACGLSRRAVYRAIGRGELPAARLCNRLRVRPADLARWIAERMENPPPIDTVPPTGAVRAPVRGSLRAMLDQQQRTPGGDR
ncbi:MAG: helix-turn-helix domain-containing protein [Solirubrobacterales bacterium]